MREEQEMVAYALETTAELLEFIPELLADLDELGSDAEQVMQVVAGLDLPMGARVIDLGCGKGATALSIAEHLSLSVVGIDLFAPFVDHCRQVANESSASSLCEFIQGDVAKLVGRVEPADVVIFAALGDVLGRLDETIQLIRQYVKTSGYLVISDAFIDDDGTANFPGFEHYAKHTETLARLSSCGDRLIKEVLEVVDDDDVDEVDESALIVARAEALSLRYPQQADAIMAFGHSQAAENEYIDDNLTGAIWVLQKTA